jgi:hypothetical protein
MTQVKSVQVFLRRSPHQLWESFSQLKRAICQLLLVVVLVTMVSGPIAGETAEYHFEDGS